MLLFIADKLAWDKRGIPPFYEEVDSALGISLEAACYKYMEYMVEDEMILFHMFSRLLKGMLFIILKNL